ncbi:hypothetical protein LZ575_14450 [Antarcticibacterium sp. 1MA-6-2]|uniref:HEPN domain-containing protein n=1 Tax=Antarcticibacterium sp. 1MA-6-2 TaxID=2908210 RepID=UPI001F32C497|nr:HEPN domain-containing protein [Antarcticibacterium sp. 1MA-6-2]UJH90107.1 hypothetical protein LZ575_14450 [Antarcticibacterium sp. 1MA-6-2]
MSELFICSTRYLRIKEKNFDIDFGFSKFSDKDTFLKKVFESKNSVYHFGINHLPPLENTPYFYNAIDENETPEVRIRNSEKFLEYFQTIISNLWFIKDCSCNTREYLDISNKTNNFFNRSRTIFFSNSEGLYKDGIFTIQEILQSIEITEKIIELQNNDLPDETISNKPNQNLGNITPGDINYLLYHSTNRIQRAIMFLTVARSNSFLPLKISFYIGILETLFTTDNSEVTHKVSERVSFYLKDDFEKLKTFKTIKECYAIRSKFVHGQKLHKKYSNDKLKQTSSQLDNIVRVLLKKVIEEDSEVFSEKSDLDIFFNKLIFT